MEAERNTWFPLYVNMKGKKILVIGGGTIACRRIRTLLSFQPSICCVAPNYQDELGHLAKEGRIKLLSRIFYPDDLEEADLVLICTNSNSLNRQIAGLCKEKGIPVNNCSDQTECDFFFPAVIRTQEDAVISINAGGRDHRLVKRIREKLQILFSDEADK